MAYNKPLFCQQEFGVEFDWQHVDVFSEAFVSVQALQ